jgi:hypothetical protein
MKLFGSIGALRGAGVPCGRKSENAVLNTGTSNVAL